MTAGGSTGIRPVVVAELVAEAVLTVPGVLELHSGAVGEFATYGGGDRVRGVRIRTGDQPRIETRVVASYGWQLPDLADEVRARVSTTLAGHVPELVACPVDVRIADVRAGNGADS